MKKTSKFLKAVLAICIAGVTIFTLSDGVAAKTDVTEKINISLVGKYDSADTAAIRAVDTDNKTIRFRNHATGKTYTLNYDNTSMMYDSYGNALSPRLLEEGEIVNVTFLKSSKHITTLKVSDEAWVIDNTRDHDLVREDGTARIRGDVYKIDPRTLIMADEKLALSEDILSTDKISVSGIGKDIYSIVVQSGHGYVSLSSDVVEDHSLVGAWLELDNEVIYKISPNMLLSAPEGDYTLQILGNGANYQSEVNISRNQETVVDTSKVNITKPKEGLVTFEITPDTAEVFVDGSRMLTNVPQTIQYGYHNLKIMADGYVTQSKFLKVGTPKSVVSIELEKDADASSDSSSSESSAAASVATTQPQTDNSSKEATKEPVQISSNSATTASTQQTVSSNSSEEKPKSRVIEGCKIYIDEPNGAELYFDGNYIGLIPTNVAKVSGNHEVIIKKDGYETKSYRIHIDSESTDLKYEFPPLVKVKKEESSDSSSSASTSKPDSSTDASSDASSEASSDSSSDASSDASSEASSDSSSKASSDASDESASKASSNEPEKESSKESSGNAESTESTPSKESSQDSTANTSEAPTEAPSEASTSQNEGNENTQSDAASAASASSGE